MAFCGTNWRVSEKRSTLRKQHRPELSSAKRP